MRNYRSKALGYIQIIRPLNSMMIGTAVMIGVLIASPVPKLTDLLQGFATAFLLASASMVVNDYCDREIDLLNNPSKPIPSGLIKPNEALVYAFSLSIVGLVAALFTDPLCFVIAITFLAIATIYNIKGKRLGILGNFMVASCVAIPFIYGGLMVAPRVNLLLQIFTLLAFLSAVGREITKGIADMEGDKLRGARTVPILIGTRNAAYLAATFYILAVALSLLPLILGLVLTFPYLVAISMADVGFIASSISLVNDYSMKNSIRVKSRVLVWMALGLVGFVVGRL